MTENPSDEQIVAEIAADLLAQGLTEDNPIDTAKPTYTEDEYPTYNTKDTRVVSGPIGYEAKYPGARYTTWRDAFSAVSAKHNVVKFWTLKARWFARVYK